MLINFFVFLKNHVLQIYNFHMTSWAQIFSTFLVQIFLFSSFFYDSLQQQPSEKYYVNKLEFKICFQQSVLDYYYQQIVIILMYCKQQLQLLVDMFWCQIYFSKKCLFLCRIFLDFSMFYAQTQNLCIEFCVSMRKMVTLVIRNFTLFIVLDCTFYLFSWYIYILAQNPYIYLSIYFSFVTFFLHSCIFLLFLFVQFYIQFLDCAHSQRVSRYMCISIDTQFII
eukprot:TRINITY_DN1448_c0_g1_i4.p1 TRINITY_DN1448_c0_g1~~TRINITY_DN1448_c0_g1_i4.p1  ORF type:complete len:224 (+),score=-38.50 TRINITY_DN1448_c0_g1_i4:108-779(+)